MSLHRTWIRPDGSGKAAIDPARLWWPGQQKAGGVIRLWPDDEVTTGLAIAEGIENALVAARGFPLVWACADAGNLKSFPVLPGIEALTIVADHDPAGVGAAQDCARRWREAGAEVRIFLPPDPGDDVADWASVP